MKIGLASLDICNGDSGFSLQLCNAQNRGGGDKKDCGLKSCQSIWAFALAWNTIKYSGKIDFMSRAPIIWELVEHLY